MITDYIAQYAKAHNIRFYNLKSKVLTKEDFVNTLTFAPEIAFFYRLKATGIINNINNISEAFVSAGTNSEYYDFGKLVTIKDYNSVQVAESDFIFVSDNMLKLQLHEGSNALFNQILTLQLQYFVLTKLSGSEVKETQKQDKVIIDINK